MFFIVKVIGVALSKPRDDARVRMSVADRNSCNGPPLMVVHAAIAAERITSSFRVSVQVFDASKQQLTLLDRHLPASVRARSLRMT